MRYAVVFAVLCLGVGTVVAQDRKEASSEQIVVRASDLPPGLAKELQAKYQFEKMGQYAGLGREIGEGMNGALSAFTDNAEKFGSTRVGTFAMVMVAWKIMGIDLAQIIFGSAFFLVWVYIMVSYFLRNCRRYSYLKSEAAGEKTYAVFDPRDEDYVMFGVIAIVGGVMWALITFP